MTLPSDVKASRAWTKAPNWVPEIVQTVHEADEIEVASACVAFRCRDFEL